MYEEIIKFLMQELYQDNSGHNHQHAFRVVANARKIMRQEGGDERIILTAAYLHDCIDKKLFVDISLQIEKIRELLIKQMYSLSEIDEILNIMENISFNNGNFKELHTLNAQIVRDADRLDAIGAMGIIRTIEYGASRKRPFYDDINIKKEEEKNSFGECSNSTISHFYEKLFLLKNLMHTSTAKAMADERDKFLHQFIEEFYKEV